METKITDFFKFCFTKQLRYAIYDLETCCSYLGSIKHTYTWLSYLSQLVHFFFFFFFLLWILRFYTRFKMCRTPVLLKNYLFHNFLNRSNIATLSHFSNQKLFKCIIHLSLFMHTLQNNTILSKSDIFLNKEKALYNDGTPDH